MSTAVANTEKMGALRAILERSKRAIAAVLPKHLTPERIIRITTVAASRNPLLLQCDTMSVLRSVMTASQLGLEPDGPLGSAYLVPYKNNKAGGRYECQLIVGYRGLIDLARRSGQIVSIEAHVVHERDSFSCEFGLEPVLKHTPAWKDADPGAVIAVYAVAKLKDGGVQAEVMTKAQVDAIRTRSRAGQSGPWVSDYEEMARKTVVKRLVKYLPMSVEMSTAIDADNAADTGEQPFDAIDIPVVDEAGGNGNGSKSKAEALAEQIGAGNPTDGDEAAKDALWDEAYALGQQLGYKDQACEAKANEALKAGEQGLRQLVASLKELLTAQSVGA